MSESVEFASSFPPIQSAIKLDGQGGARIQLDIPESDLDKFLPAVAWRGEAFTVRITRDSQRFAGGREKNAVRY